MKKERQKNIAASYLILLKENQILLLKRFNTGYEDGKYSFIAGHVDNKETFTQAIIREAYEEAGIRIHEKDLHVAHVMHRNSIDSQRVDVFFLAKSWQGKLFNKEPNKCNELSWFDINHLPQNIIPFIQKTIKCVMNNIYYSEYGWN